MFMSANNNLYEVYGTPSVICPEEEYKYSPIPNNPHPALLEHLDEWQIAISSNIWNIDEPTKRYIFSRALIALDQELKYGIDAGYNLSQGILESNRGQSGLSRKSNNDFCRKRGSSWSGATVAFKDDDYDAEGNLVYSAFRKFGSPADSWEDHSRHLLVMYEGTADAESVWEFYNALQYGRHRYASSSRYIRDGVSIYRKYNLKVVSNLLNSCTY
jgi:flagellum-specific peptidoglycan hydrolase FlgJ